MTATDASDRRQWVLGLVEQFEVRLTRFALRITGDEETARDVVQHAFLRLCDRPPDAALDRADQWLFAVCRNRAVDVLRARRRTSRLADDMPFDVQSQEPDPAMTAERKDLYRQLCQLVAGLPPSQREVVDLWAEGFSYREIAEITDRNEITIRVKIHRALKTLRGHPRVRQMLGGTRSTRQLPTGSASK
jgi:RNA polymerase sigma-70 factor (ECF subfamily)